MRKWKGRPRTLSSGRVGERLVGLGEGRREKNPLVRVEVKGCNITRDLVSSGVDEYSKLCRVLSCMINRGLSDRVDLYFVINSKYQWNSETNFRSL